MDEKYDFRKIESKWPSFAKATDGKQGYDFKKIESKWQEEWDKLNYGKAEDFSEKPKHYNLVEFPYPSGSGLHVGHCMGYGASDAFCRMKRMQGFNVLFPIGWDAFGLPTENYAIKTGVQPKIATKKNIENFRTQMKSLGFSFDYNREVDTTDPDYYRWTQWIFLQFYKHGIVDGKLVEVADDDFETPRLAYQAEMPINWCPSCKIGLANEEVINGKCERCGGETIKKMQKQWMLRITAYADRLIDDLDTVEYLPKIKTQQVNWIGRSNGSEIRFKIKNQKSKIKNNVEDSIKVFTTRADTLFGCTYLVLSPEHEIISKIKNQISNINEVEDYINEAKKKSDLERTDLVKDKTGVELDGVKAINPINGEEIGIYVADYVLASYGTGAVMAVPAHDERDFEFAKKYHIPIKYVIEPKFVSTNCDNAVKPELEFKKRNAICAIVRNPKNDKYLCISWNGVLMHGLVTGGIEDNEDLVDTAKREVREETGYKNLKFIKVAPLAINTFFYHRVKKENRWAHFQYVFFDLENEDRNEVSKEEADQHEVLWKSKNELKDFFTVFEGDYLAELLEKEERAFTDYGILTNSGEFDFLESKEAIKKITEKLMEMGAGDFATNYKLRDWVFSRQHYWGEPIPIIYCRKCLENQKSKVKNQKYGNVSIINGEEYMVVPVLERDLPIVLPEVEKYQPTDTGESPLASISDWVNTTCPRCGGSALRETDTMPNWAGSSWYFLRYCDPRNDKRLASDDILNYWIPVDLYNGGMEHTTLHLLYSRFWHKFLYDLKIVPTPEPYKKRIAHGIILGPDNQKMSKSRGNVINPDDIVKEFGADTLRAYIMFIGPYDQESAWSTNGLLGVSRFLNKVWQNAGKVKENISNPKLEFELNKLISSITSDIENYQLNTYIAKLMTFNNLLSDEKEISRVIFEKFCQLLFPTAPHIAEEIWQGLGNKKSISESSWPEFNKEINFSQKDKIAVEVNGKLRAVLEVEPEISKDELEKIALEDEKVKKYLESKEIKKVIVVPKRIVSIVTD